MDGNEKDTRVGQQEPLCGEKEPKKHKINDGDGPEDDNTKVSSPDARCPLELFASCNACG